MSRLAYVLTTVCVCVPLMVPLSGCSSDASASSSLRVGNQRAQLANYLEEVLGPVSKAARVYYYVPHACGSGPDAAMQFPDMDLHTPEHGDIGISGVRRIFSAYHDVSITHHGDKLIAVRIGTPSNHVLMTRFKFVKVSNLAKYNPGLVILGIMHKKSVRTAIANAGLTLPITPFVGMVMPPSQRPRHSHGRAKDVTVDEALDRVAVTFNGVLVYSTCKARNGKRVVQIYFNAFQKTK